MWLCGYSTNPQSEWYPGNSIEYSLYTNPTVVFNISDGVEIDDFSNPMIIIQPEGTKHADLIISERDEIRMRFYNNGIPLSVDEYLFNISIKEVASGGILNYNHSVSVADDPCVIIYVNRTVNVPITNAIAGIFSISCYEQYLAEFLVYY